MVDQIGSAHLDLDILEDEDQFRHRLSFWIRKSCFIFVLAVVLTISVSVRSFFQMDFCAYSNKQSQELENCDKSFFRVSDFISSIYLICLQMTDIQPLNCIQ
eukprot:TRINITY_DN6263_c0_g2_i1.p1 TRINITY_DN6263_c0_g2~~TRINITY_DN6263_c0_g2_i1.p1  ORF type:complete len:102 (-),score=14.35 TRINITY_DN6263_c0_g2_i1:253-558(-)